MGSGEWEGEWWMKRKRLGRLITTNAWQETLDWSEEAENGGIIGEACPSEDCTFKGSSTVQSRYAIL